MEPDRSRRPVPLLLINGAVLHMNVGACSINRCQKEKGGLDRWFRGQEHLMRSQGTQVLFPAPISRLTTILTPAPGDLMPSSDLLRYQAPMWYIHIHVDEIFIH